MKALTASEARRTLFTLIEEAVEFEEEFYITSRKGTAVLVSADVYSAMNTTLELFRDPVGGMRLLQSIMDIRNGVPGVEVNMEQLREMLSPE